MVFKILNSTHLGDPSDFRKIFKLFLYIKIIKKKNQLEVIEDGAALFEKGGRTSLFLFHYYIFVYFSR